MPTPSSPPHRDPPSLFRQLLDAPDPRPWLTWSPALPPLLWLLGTPGFVSRYALALFVLTLSLLALNAVRFYPARGSDARRRIALVLLIVVPPILAVAGGPFGPMGRDGAIANTPLFETLETSAMAGAVLIPVALLPLLRGGRRFVIFTGIIALLATFIVYAVGSLIVDPGS